MSRLKDLVLAIPDDFFPLSMARVGSLLKISYYKVRSSAKILWPDRPAYSGLMKAETMQIAELITARPVGGKAVRKMGASFYVGLPPSWVRFNGLDKGGRVYISVTDAGVLEVSATPRAGENGAEI